MIDLLKSMVKLSFAMPILAAKRASELVVPRGSEGSEGSLASDLDRVTRVFTERLEGTAREVYNRGEELTRGVIPGQAAKGAGEKGSEGKEAKAPRGSVTDSGSLDTRTIVVLGEGLAAGFGDFSLAEEFQRESFPYQLAARMGRDLPQPAMESPGIGDAPGFYRLPVLFPALMQTTGMTALPPKAPVQNLSVPGFRLADALGLRPAAPLVQQNDARQTLANVILGLPEMLDGGEGRSQLERAIALEPTFVVVELGYYEVLEASVASRPEDIPDPAEFRAGYEKLLSALTSKGAKVLALTIPDPVHTAYHSTIESAAANLKVEPSLLLKTYALAPDDLVSVPALVEMGFQLLSDRVGPPPKGSIQHGAVAAEISKRVSALNNEIRAVVTQHGGEVFDLAGLFAEVAREGVRAGSRVLTADFLGGFYLLNGYYPGATGHAFIANAIARQLNETFGAAIPPIDLESVLGRDPAAQARRAQGPNFQGKEFQPVPGKGVTEVAHARSSQAKRPKKATATSSRLTLPVGLEQTLPLSKAASYFGDAIRAANCRNADDRMFGGGREMLFGGLCLTDSHLSGDIRITFSEPKDDMSHFEVRHGRLEGDDGTLQAPQFFKLPSLRNEVRDDDTLVTSGDLDLATGEVTNLHYAGRFFNTALLALVRVNPKLPNLPIEFPGLYGTAWAKFEQRDNGNLDFTFYGSTFIPMGGEMEGDPVRFPLPFAGPTLEFASIPGPGTALHPHLHLSTKEPEEADAALVPEIPTNEVREYTLYTRNTSFGDKFTLHAEDLSGDPTGRSHLLGRLQIQFGPPCGDSVPVVVYCLNPGGMLCEEVPNPLSDEFPGRLPPSPVGHNEFLRFATRSYYLDALTCIDDPFDVALGNVSQRSGIFLAEHLHRALIGQNLFYALIRVEPRTPKSSFFFRGPARFEKGSDGRPVFRFSGQVTVPYPEGFLFPSPDLATGVAIGPHSQLDPFYWIQAMQHDRTAAATLSGSVSRLVSSANEEFSYKYDISGDPARKPPVFEYKNNTLNGLFTLKSLNWVSFTNSRGSKAAAGSYDTVSFSGFGTWSRLGVQTRQVVCVQISEAQPLPYVSIQVGGGRISNVNTKPENLDDVRP